MHSPGRALLLFQNHSGSCSSARHPRRCSSVDSFTRLVGPPGQPECSAFVAAARIVAIAVRARLPGCAARESRNVALTTLHAQDVVLRACAVDVALPCAGDQIRAACGSWGLTAPFDQKAVDLPAWQSTQIEHRLDALPPRNVAQVLIWIAALCHRSRLAHVGLRSTSSGRDGSQQPEQRITAPTHAPPVFGTPQRQPAAARSHCALQGVWRVSRKLAQRGYRCQTASHARRTDFQL